MHHQRSLFSFAGSASFNISGVTIHSGLKIPPEYSPNDICPSLDGDRLASLQDAFIGTKVLIIDEKSMISATRYKQIDLRCREINPEMAHLPFGGMSLIVLGDNVSCCNFFHSFHFFLHLFFFRLNCHQ